jgi:ElaB/YqjD/DUF883 family membrane-anchored ribosome-binding protein
MDNQEPKPAKEEKITMSNKSGAVKQVKEVISEEAEVLDNKTANLQNKVSGSVSSITEKIHQGADSGKAILNDGAEKANELAQQAIDKANDLKHRVAEKVSDTTDYVKNIDLQSAKDSVRDTVKERPEVLLITVGILGLAVGYLLGKKTA